VPSFSCQAMPRSRSIGSTASPSAWPTSPAGDSADKLHLAIEIGQEGCQEHVVIHYSRPVEGAEGRRMFWTLGLILAFTAARPQAPTQWCAPPQLEKCPWCTAKTAKLVHSLTGANTTRRSCAAMCAALVCRIAENGSHVVTHVASHQSREKTRAVGYEDDGQGVRIGLHRQRRGPTLRSVECFRWGEEQAENHSVSRRILKAECAGRSARSSTASLSMR
jgi:hypothetical protein